VKVDCVIVAAGSASRFGANKLLAKLEGRPVVAWSLAAMAACSSIEHLVLVAPAGETEAFEAIAAGSVAGRCLAVVPGGARRRDSVEAGLHACNTRYVAIHDGARPCVTPELVERVASAADGNPGAIAAIPVTDTIKEVIDGVIRAHPGRERLWAAQTPQVVLRQAWLDAAAMSDNDETDDAAMLARLGLACVVADGDPDNLKITRPRDLDLARMILRERAST
jgi:2-C-methyl-D-erythritol 4-phosphate cytidylyltransferase